MKEKTLNYDLMRLAQVNAEVNKRETRAKEYLARNKNNSADEENPSDFQLILAGLGVFMPILAIYFVGCLF